MHCASLGEFEQGRPVLEAIRRQYPQYKIVLTFFSPSGYEVRKNYEGADYIFYLPMDGRYNAKSFLDAVNPSLIFFVKYEFWYFYLSEIRRRNIPALLISAAFRKEQAFFKWYGGFFRKMLHGFTHILVQDNESALLLNTIGINKQVQIAGDTRYDRVLEIAAQARELPVIASFKAGQKILIAGSTWPADEAIIKDMLTALPSDWKVIIAPHEIDAPNMARVMALFGNDAVLYAAYQAHPDLAKKILIIDNIGMLSSAYKYGDIAFVGGGFDKGGIHNVLEPAAFGTPVIIGPVYQKFVEAVQLVTLGYVLSVTDAATAKQAFTKLMNDPAPRTGISTFMRQQKGATDTIMKLAAAYL